MNILIKKSITPLLLLLGVLFVLLYPMLISIYVFLPLCIGAMGYLLVYGIDKNKPLVVLIAIVYALNLEINLSLPLFMIVISVLLFTIFIYPYLKHFGRCNICQPLLSVLFIDGMYLACLFSYDFIFQTQSIVLDKILLYSLIVDMLIVVIV